MSDRQRRSGGRKRRRFRDRRDAGGRESGSSGARGQAQEARPPQQQRQAQSSGQNSRQGQRQRGQRRQPDRDEAARRQQAGRKKGPAGGEGKRGGREREPRLQYKSVVVLPEEQASPCPLCGKPVRDAVSALGYGEEHAPAHFDCVMERLRATRELRPDEQLCYLGGGNFGVVRFGKGEGAPPFTIGERISYEPQHERPQWRKDLDSVTRR